MKTLHLKNKKKQHIFNYIEKKRLIWRFYLKTFNNASLELVLYNILYNHNQTKPWHLCQTINRCVITHRARSVYRLVKLSRIMFKAYVLRGLLIGFIKANW